MIPSSNVKWWSKSVVTRLKVGISDLLLWSPWHSQLHAWWLRRMELPQKSPSSWQTWWPRLALPSLVYLQKVRAWCNNSTRCGSSAIQAQNELQSLLDSQSNPRLWKGKECSHAAEKRTCLDINFDDFSTHRSRYTSWLSGVAFFPRCFRFQCPCLHNLNNPWHPICLKENLPTKDNLSGIFMANKHWLIYDEACSICSLCLGGTTLCPANWQPIRKNPTGISFAECLKDTIAYSRPLLHLRDGKEVMP